MCTCLLDGQKVVNSQPLYQRTDFNWYGEITLPDRYEGRQITVYVVVRFANGEVAETRGDFCLSGNKKNGKSERGLEQFTGESGTYRY